MSQHWCQRPQLPHNTIVTGTRAAAAEAGWFKSETADNRTPQLIRARRHKQRREGQALLAVRQLTVTPLACRRATLRQPGSTQLAQGGELHP